MSVEREGAAAPLACNLSEAALEERGGEVRALFAAVQQVEELADGYGFAFPGDAGVASQLLDFVVTERECCPFFTFALVFAPDHRRIWLHLRGSAEIKALLAQDWLSGI